MRQIIIDLSQSKKFIYLVGLLSFICWIIMHFFHFPTFYFGYTILLLFFILILFGSVNAQIAAPIVFYLCFALDSLFNQYSSVPIYLIITSSIMIFIAVFFLIKQRKNFILGKISLSWIILIIAFFLSFLINISDNIFYSSILLLSLPVYFLLYLFFINALKDSSKEYIALVILFGGVICALEKFAVILQHPIALVELGKYKSMGGFANSIISSIEMWLSLGMGIYLTLRSEKKIKIWYLFLTSIVFWGIVLSICRGVIGIMLLMLIPFIVVTYHYTKNKKKFLYLVGGIAIFIIIISLCFFPQTCRLFEYIFKKINLSSLSGRIPLWKEAIDNFNTSIISRIFGNSLSILIKTNNDAIFINSPHNVYLLVLEVSGLIGFFCFVYHLYETTMVIKKSSDAYQRIVLITLIGSFIHSFFDNLYFWPCFMISYLIIISSLELDINEKMQIKTSQ